jgi:hypothetical protein
MLATPRAIGPLYRGECWPAVVPCAFPGCPLRRCARGAAEDWRCPAHEDEWSRHQSLLADVLAQRTHDALMAPPTGAPEPEPPRRYVPAPTARTAPGWTPEGADDAA